MAYFFSPFPLSSQPDSALLLLLPVAAHPKEEKKREPSHALENRNPRSTLLLPSSPPAALDCGCEFL
ncbi:hypothetical protein SLEP1_g26349 [Rubroshorea leprosula]|uniref:Uncharacterized protein n=1 Tax=Rubroshorea leprosula TaxID=152421 RepID=A0AAV5JPM6_9ROSI|nr:hypothetical protein SLEP1_g26349 [Rubroshorea leprosula]